MGETFGPLVVGRSCSLDAVESRHLRMRLAADLRDRLDGRFDQATRGQIVGAFVLAVPGVVGVADDTERRVQGLRDQLMEAAQRIRALGEPLSQWVPELARRVAGLEGAAR